MSVGEVNVTGDVTATLCGGPWQESVNRIKYQLKLTLKLTSAMLDGGIVRNWKFKICKETATFTNGWLNAYNAAVDHPTHDKPPVEKECEFVNVDPHPNPVEDRRAGREIEFYIELIDTDGFESNQWSLDKSQWSFFFQDLDEVVNPPQAGPSEDGSPADELPEDRPPPELPQPLHPPRQPLPEPKTRSDPTEEGAASRYFSVAVNPPPTDGEYTLTPPYHTNESGPLYTYFRMGMPDIQSEPRLPADQNNMSVPGGFTKSDPGILLYTTGKYTLKAKEEAKDVTTGFSITRHGNAFASAEYTTAKDDAEPMKESVEAVFGGAKITVKHLHEVTSAMGTKIDSIVGAGESFWSGVQNKYGLGWNIAAVFGQDVKVSPKETITFGLKFTEIKATGLTNVVKDNKVFSAGDIWFGSSPTNDALSTETFKDARVLIQYLFAVAPLVMGAVSAMFAIVHGNEKEPVETELKNDLRLAAKELGGLSSVCVLIQAVICLAAGILRGKQTAAAIQANLDNKSASILSLTNDAKKPTFLQRGDRRLTFDASGNVILANGSLDKPDTPSIIMTDKALILRVENNMIAITSDGVTITGKNVTVNSPPAPTGGTLTLAAQGALLVGGKVGVAAMDAAGHATAGAAFIGATAAQTQAAAARRVYEAAAPLMAALDAAEEQLEINAV